MKTFTISIIFICLAISLHGQEQELRDAANRALDDLKALAALKDIRMKDMPTPEMLADARLGDMLSHSIIKLDRLKEYTSTSDPKEFIEKIDRTTFPVLNSSNAVISAVELEKSTGTWRTADLGNTTYVKAAEMVLKDHNLNRIYGTLIRVPAFNLYFLGIPSGRGTELALLSDKPFNNIPPQRFESASEVLTQLNTVAKSYNGLPW